MSYYTLVWNDEFDYTNVNDLFDGPNAKWTDLEVGNVPYRVLDPSTNTAAQIISRDQVQVSNGLLSLFAEEAPTPNYSVIYNGTQILSKQKASFMRTRYDGDYGCTDNDYPNAEFWGFDYGAFEIRAKLPMQNSDFSAFWLWQSYWAADVCDPAPINNWCDAGYFPAPHPNNCPDGINGCAGYEIDVFETYKSESSIDGVTSFLDGSPFKYFATIQDNIYQEPTCKECATYYRWLDSDPSKNFHTYTVVWTPTKVSFFIDGNEIRTSLMGIPPVKLMIYLTNWKHNDDSYDTGTTDPFVVGYVRVYRPSMINYAVGTNGKLWSSFDVPERAAYLAALNGTPYTTQNFNFAELQDASQSSTTDVASEMVVGEAFQNLVETAFYTSSSVTRLNRINISGTHSNCATNVKLNSPMAIEYDNGTSPKRVVYYVGTDNRIWSYNELANCTQGCVNTVKVDPNNTYPADVSITQGLVFAPANNIHPKRIYYANTSGLLCYFEFCTAQSKYLRHVTNVTGVRGSLNVDDAGTLVYQGTDFHLWRVTSPTGPACNSNYVVFSTNTTVDQPYSVQYNDCAGDIFPAHSSIGNIYYLKRLKTVPVQHRLAYWRPTATGWKNEVIDEVNDIRQIVSARDVPGLGLEIFYLSTRNKLKTWYERPAPLYNGEKQYQRSSVNVFSYMLNNYNTSLGRQDTFAVEKAQINAAAVSKNGITRVYVSQQTPREPAYGGSFGYYQRTSMPQVSPPNRAGQCDVHTQNNAWDHYNGLELRLAPPVTEPYSFTAYPNPNGGSFVVSIKGLETEGLIKLYNAYGQLVQESLVLPITDTEHEVQNLPPGVYIVTLVTSGQIKEHKKIIVNQN